jgi:hypothetical protein
MFASAACLYIRLRYPCDREWIRHPAGQIAKELGDEQQHICMRPSNTTEDTSQDSQVRNTVNRPTHPPSFPRTS